MLFNSLIFICIFLPIVLLVYYILPAKAKNIFLMLASLFFYYWGGTKYTLILVAMTVANYILGLLMDKYVRYSKWFLAAGIVFSLSLLGYYKYMGFFVVNANKLLGGILEPVNIVLPIGISFFTFQGLSYLIDVYRYVNCSYEGNDRLSGCKVQKNPFKLLLYISLFPQLIAGPIVRYKDVSEQIDYREHSIRKISDGVERFIYGLAKKVIVADTMALVADRIFALAPSQTATEIAWVGIISYTLQIFFDFSGYSDMAIGLGKMFGFEFAENFDLPYISRSITEFWRRWHISLSSWFRDYVYIPLGGNKKGNVYLNLAIVFALTGIWHGASWAFLAWGVWHGFFIVIERMLKKAKLKVKVPAFIGWIYAMLVVIFGWVFFRAESLSNAFVYLKKMFGMGTLEFQPFEWGYYWDGKTLFVMGIAILLSVLPVRKWLNKIREYRLGEAAIKLWSVLLFLMCLLVIVNSHYSPFIYFRF